MNKIHSSNLDQDTNYTDFGFSLFYPYPADNI
jgi:hypothetical protein